MAEAPKTLGEFIQGVMDDHHYSNSQFAQVVGVDKKLINTYVHHGSKDVGNPSMGFLLKLAAATDTNVLTLVVLTYPELREPLEALTRQSITSAMRNERIEQLPDYLRQAVDTIIFEHTHTRNEENGNV